MRNLTDPARELAELCVVLRSGNLKLPGHAALAEAFRVVPWSAQFYQIIFTIVRRVDDLGSLISQLDIDEDLGRQAEEHLARIKLAFSENRITNVWSHSTANFISPEHVNPIGMLSPIVRQMQSYPKLGTDEQAELFAVIDELLDWLRNRQLSEQDFIRQAIVDGLEQFRFRLERIQWLGWGYTLQSLREVIGAYLALERGTPDPGNAPDAKAVLVKVGVAVKSIYSKIGFAKDLSDRVQFMVEAYKWSSAALLTAKAGVLFLTSS